MDWDLIPQDDEGFLNSMTNRMNKIHYRIPAEIGIVGKQVEIESESRSYWTYGECTNCRDTSVRIGNLDHGGLATGRPRSSHYGLHHEPALVNENKMRSSGDLLRHGSELFGSSSLRHNG